MCDDYPDTRFPTLPECPICEGVGSIVDEYDLEHTCFYCEGTGFVEDFS